MENPYPPRPKQKGRKHHEWGYIGYNERGEWSQCQVESCRQIRVHTSEGVEIVPRSKAPKEMGY